MAQIAVFVDFENLVLGAVKELPDQANPAPYEAHHPAVPRVR